MEKKYMEKLIGKYCKIVTKEPGEDRASVVSGILEGVDYDDGFVLVDSEQGLGCLRINTIVAIKPGRKRKIDEKSLKNDEKGMIGIGTLIIFIAMVLVAAVAASVLIQTSQTLQTHAYKVAGETIQEVAGGVKIEDIAGYTNAEKTHVQYLAIAIAPRAGSEYIDLENMFVSLRHDNLTAMYFDSTLVEKTINSSGVFHTIDESQLNSTNYGVVIIHDSDDSISNTNGMNIGDSAYLILNMSASLNNNGLLPRASIAGKVIPELGTEALFDSNIPCVFINRIVDLY
ncbi:MAG: hypothetical protein JSW62_01390 [Thermoplasmatales archaeon]|nr:MAG: hypothetical protein JSW62_01390 [Thermoplasmatales archaeon]